MLTLTACLPSLHSVSINAILDSDFKISEPPQLYQIMMMKFQS